MADKYRKIFIENDYADGMMKREKQLGNIKPATQEKWDMLSQKMKDFYKTYEAYVEYTNTQNTITKNAIKQKLIQRKTDFQNESLFTVEEKSGYLEEVDKVISTITIKVIP